MGLASSDGEGDAGSDEDGDDRHGDGDRRVGAGREDERVQVLGLIVIPELGADGRLRMVADQVTVGRLNLPTGPIQKLRSVLDGLVARDVLGSDDAEWVVDFLSGEIPIDPVMDLADDRRVRLMRINAPAVGVLDLTCETLPPEN